MKIGFLSLPLMGHLNSMTALAKLPSRGHEVVFFEVPDVDSGHIPMAPHQHLFYGCYFQYFQ